MHAERTAEAIHVEARHVRVCGEGGPAARKVRKAAAASLQQDARPGLAGHAHRRCALPAPPRASALRVRSPPRCSSGALRSLLLGRQVQRARARDCAPRNGATESLRWGGLACALQPCATESPPPPLRASLRRAVRWQLTRVGLHEARSGTRRSELGEERLGSRAEFTRGRRSLLRAASNESKFERKECEMEARYFFLFQIKSNPTVANLPTSEDFSEIVTGRGLSCVPPPSHHDLAVALRAVPLDTRNPLRWCLSRRRVERG
jgi:hypothetical protein